MASREKINELVVRPLQEMARQMFPVTLPSTAPHGTRITVDGAIWEAVQEGKHFFWERQDSAREWINSPCAYGCDCGQCYSRSPDDESSHHCEPQ